MLLTLQIENHRSSDAASDVMPVIVEVVRTGPAGMGLRFVRSDLWDHFRLLQFLARWKTGWSGRRVSLALSPGQPTPLVASRRQGQAVLEFCLVFPLMFLLVINVVNFGVFMYDWISVANAARAGVQYWVTGNATVFAPDVPTGTQITNLINNELSSLNGPSVTVNACTNNNGTTACILGSSTNPPSDPESPTYAVAWVDVSFTYTRLFNWPFPAAAPLPSTIHRRAVMRVLQ